MDADESRNLDVGHADRYRSLRRPWWRALFWRVLPGACALLGCAVGVFAAYIGLTLYYQSEPPGGYYGEIAKVISMLVAWGLCGGVVGAVIGWWIGIVLAARRPS